MIQGCCTWTLKRNIDLLVRWGGNDLPRNSDTVTRSTVTIKFLVSQPDLLFLGGETAAIDRTSAQQYTQHSACTHKNSEGSIKNVLCQRLQNLHLYFLNQDKKRMYEWWDTDTQPELRILRWSNHFIYWGQNLLLYKTVCHSMSLLRLGNVSVSCYSVSIKNLLLICTC